MAVSARLDLEAASRHAGAQVVSSSPLRVLTPSACWAYALSFAPPTLRIPIDDHDAVITKVDIEVITGRVGIGWTNEPGTSYLVEQFAVPGRTWIALTVPLRVEMGRLIMRNANLDSLPSDFVLHAIEVEHGRVERPPYPVSVSRRELASEVRPADGGINVFDDELAASINVARIAWLEAAGLPVAGTRVLDVGCGVGHFASYYLQRGCTVVGIDGREENIAALRQRHPAVEGYVADVQRTPLAPLGRFDVLHCFGLLYHLDSPVAALRRMAAVCDDFMILETMVCDSSRPLAVLADETRSVNQALEGLGCRPSPSYVALALNRIGFHYVYGTTQPPRHPDFQFSWQDNLDIARDGHNLRAMFVASRRPLDMPLLVSLLDR